MSETGDATEDPEHPKIIWPSVENCPNCRGDEFTFEPFQTYSTAVQGQMWYVDRVADYLVKVYGKANVVPNNVTMTDRVRGQSDVTCVRKRKTSTR